MAAAACACSGAATVLRCGYFDRRGSAFEISQETYHGILHAALQAYLPNSVAARRKGRPFRCTNCKQMSYDLWWFDAGRGFLGGVCAGCVRKVVVRAFGQELGSAEPVRTLRLTATKKSLALLERYQTALKQDEFVVRPEVLQLF